MASISLVCGVALIAVIVVVILKKARKILLTSNWYKRIFAGGEAQFAETTRKVFAPLKEKIFADLSEHLKTVKGDVLEIGIGSGENFDYYPHGTSLIAVDCNPHVQDRLKARLDKAADRVHLKKFVVASAAQLDVDDNSVAAVVCTLVVCSIDDDQTRKTLQEVKRVLKPGGRFYFLEHVAGKPWTLQYLVQQIVSKSLIWPTVFNGCRCDRETLSWIEEAGFKMVQVEKIWLDWTPGMFAGCSAITVLITKVVLCFVKSILFGFAEKGEDTEKKKSL
ncbi:methyltransferase-like protein 7A [Orbicella faveolata]|uniref:methyltransferase-like protein 7A n=1 Tax=Orbicella faveolata TaxID=48498 RepID=UPI0009E211B2|nr:methyltransferase-like protein 7A [Orbicella faveolata]